MIFSGRMLTCSLRFFSLSHEGIRQEDDTVEKPNVFFFMIVLQHPCVVFNLRFTGKPGSGTPQTSGVWRLVFVVLVWRFSILFCFISVVFISCPLLKACSHQEQ